jgi:hypothetical protein
MFSKSVAFMQTANPLLWTRWRHNFYTRYTFDTNSYKDTLKNYAFLTEISLFFWSKQK